MSVLESLARPLRRLDLEALLEMRPAYPPVAVEIDGPEAVVVRIKAAGRRRHQLEAHDLTEAADTAPGVSTFRPNLGPADEMVRRIRGSFERTGTKPGKVTLVLPDNLAKIAIVALPDRPPTRRQLAEVLRFRLRRSVPFRMEDAVVSWQEIPGEGPGMSALVAVMLRSVVEQYESVLEAVGARPGLVDLCTPSLYNLCREELRAATGEGGDAALLNCARGYFTLLIVRGGGLVFFRCKAYTAAETDTLGNGVFAREMASSISYYQEKLAGRGIGTVLVRSIARPFEEVEETLRRLGIGRVVAVDPSRALVPGGGVRLDAAAGQRLAPAIGGAMGRGR